MSLTLQTPVKAPRGKGAVSATREAPRLRLLRQRLRMSIWQSYETHSAPALAGSELYKAPGEYRHLCPRFSQWPPQLSYTVAFPGATSPVCGITAP